MLRQECTVTIFSESAHSLVFEGLGSCRGVLASFLGREEEYGHLIGEVELEKGSRK